MAALVVLACLGEVAVEAVEDLQLEALNMVMAAMAEMPWSYLFTPKTEAVTLPQS
jgi:hypothetical protein